MLLDGFHLAAVARLAGLLVGVGVWAEHTWPASGVERASSELLGNGSQVSGVSIAAGNAHFVGSWFPIGWYPVSGAEGCGPEVRELGLGGAGNHVFCPLCWHSLRAP